MDLEKENNIRENPDEVLSKLAETFFTDEKAKVEKSPPKKEKPPKRHPIRISPWIALFIVTIAFLAFYIANGRINININFPEGESLKEISKKDISAPTETEEYDTYLEEWYIPDWVLASDICVINRLIVSTIDSLTSRKSKCLKLIVDFPMINAWREVYVERLINDEDWTFYKAVSAKIFLPENAPRNLKARFILTCGKNWHWTEMKHVPLESGNWNLMEASLEAISGDWRYRGDIGDLIKNVRRLGIRIEVNYSQAYEGSIYVKDIKLIK